MHHFISLLLLAPLFVNAEGFQSELRFSAESFATDGGQNLTEEASIFGTEPANFDEEGDGYSFTATYFLDPLETKEEPFRETAFINRASFIRLDLQQEEQTLTRYFEYAPTIKTSLDASKFALSGRYLINDKKWVLDASYQHISTDQNINGQNREVAETRIKAGFGKYNEKNTLTILSLEARERTRPSSGASEYREEAYFLSGFGRHILSSYTGRRLAIEAQALLGHDEHEAYHGFVLGGSLEGRWYYNQKISVLAGIEVNKFYGENEYTSEERQETLHIARFELSYFVKPSIEVFATFSREKTRTTYDGTVTLINREKLVGGGYGLGASVRF